MSANPSSSRYIRICSVDPGIRTMASCIVDFVIDDERGKYSMELVKVSEQTLLVDKTETPSKFMREAGQSYLTQLVERIQGDSSACPNVPLFSDFVGLDRNSSGMRKILLLEENDNKYTRYIPPIIASLCRALDDKIEILCAKPKNVWTSTKHDMGWKKGDQVNRAEKKRMTRQFVRELFSLESELSSDASDAANNIYYLAKKNKFFKVSKRKRKAEQQQQQKESLKKKCIRNSESDVEE